MMNISSTSPGNALEDDTSSDYEVIKQGVLLGVSLGGQEQEGLSVGDLVISRKTIEEWTKEIESI